MPDISSPPRKKVVFFRSDLRLKQEQTINELYQAFINCNRIWPFERFLLIYLESFIAG